MEKNMKNLVVSYHKSNEKRAETHFFDGKFHRDNGPACIYYYDSGIVECEEWWIQQGPQATKHRTDGPATIHYTESGEIKHCQWYLNGVKIFPEDWLEENNYKWPLNEQQQTELILRFG